MFPHEQDAVRDLLHLIIIESQTYRKTKPLSKVEFAAYWMIHDAFVATYNNTKSTNADENLGSFTISSPTFPDGAATSAMLDLLYNLLLYNLLERGQGMGRLMGAMVEIAAIKGYTAVMFNLVFTTNTPSIRLWQSLRFETIGRILSAAPLSDGRVVDALMMYCSLC